MCGGGKLKNSLYFGYFCCIILYINTEKPQTIITNSPVMKDYKHLKTTLYDTP